MIFRLQQRKKNFESSKKPLVCLKTSGFFVGWLEVSKWRGKERFGRTGERCLMMSDLSAFKTREREGMLLNSTSIRLW